MTIVAPAAFLAWGWLYLKMEIKKNDPMSRLFMLLERKVRKIVRLVERLNKENGVIIMSQRWVFNAQNKIKMNLAKLWHFWSNFPIVSLFPPSLSNSYVKIVSFCRKVFNTALESRMSQKLIIRAKRKWFWVEFAARKLHRLCGGLRGSISGT